MFRLHIDIPLPFSEEKAKKVSLVIIEMFDLAKISFFGLDHINYRLGHDDDRQKSKSCFLSGKVLTLASKMIAVHEVKRWNDDPLA